MRRVVHTAEGDILRLDYKDTGQSTSMFAASPGYQIIPRGPREQLFADLFDRPLNTPAERLVELARLIGGGMGLKRAKKEARVTYYTAQRFVDYTVVWCVNRGIAPPPGFRNSGRYFSEWTPGQKHYDGRWARTIKQRRLAKTEKKRVGDVLAWTPSSGSYKGVLQRGTVLLVVPPRTHPNDAMRGAGIDRKTYDCSRSGFGRAREYESYLTVQPPYRDSRKPRLRWPLVAGIS